MTDDLTMPALYTVLVGDDPVRRVAIRSRGKDSWYGVIRPEGMDWRNDVHDVRPFIPAGTPVERIEVLEPGQVIVQKSDLRMATGPGGDTAGWDRLRAAARAAEPTPDSLAPARERLLSEAGCGREYVTVRASLIRDALAATEGDPS
jgi:hypothetical protein